MDGGTDGLRGDVRRGRRRGRAGRRRVGGLGRARGAGEAGQEVGRDLDAHERDELDELRGLGVIGHELLDVEGVARTFGERHAHLGLGAGEIGLRLRASVVGRSLGLTHGLAVAGERSRAGLAPRIGLVDDRSRDDDLGAGGLGADLAGLRVLRETSELGALEGLGVVTGRQGDGEGKEEKVTHELWTPLSVAMIRERDFSTISECGCQYAKGPIFYCQKAQLWLH